MKNKSIVEELDELNDMAEGVLAVPPKRELSKGELAAQMKEIAKRAHMDPEDRAAIEEEAGVIPVDFAMEKLEEAERKKAERAIASAEAINRELQKDPSLLRFLLSFHSALKQAGKAIPRKLLIESGADKSELNKLIRKGVLREGYSRHNETGQLYACLDFPEGITFYGNQAAAIVQAPDDVADLAATLEDSGLVQADAESSFAEDEDINAFGVPRKRHYMGD